MYFSRLIFCTIILFLYSENAYSDDKVITKHALKSELFGTEMNYFVKLPNTYKAGSNYSYPVVYILDGKEYVQHFYTITDQLSKGGLTPEFITVGIENKNRVRDLTPTKVEKIASSGGADTFLQYIEQELIPVINKQYQTNGFQVLAGHSFGGLFTLHAMQAKPNLFNGYFAFSPSLYWDNQTTVKSVKAYLKSDPKKQTFLYMNMGNEGLDDPYENSISMRNGYIDLAKFLEQNKSNHFRFESELMEQEYHASTIVVGTFYAFRTLYRKFPLPTATVKQGITAILQHYKNLSAELGFEVEGTLGRISNAGLYHMWSGGDLKKGIEILNYLTEKNPSSARAQNGLTQLYKADGQLDKALFHCQKSVSLSETDSSNYQQYHTLCESLEKQIQEVNQ